MSKSKEVVAVGAVVEIPLSQIQIKKEWNSRFGDFTLNEGTETEAGFKELVDSIDDRGQDTPVQVRPGKKEGTYVLVAGFRRYAAIEQLAKRDKVSNPTILASVRELTDAQACEINIRENADREDLRPPDIAWGLARTQTAQEKEGTFDSESTLARSVGLKQPYVNKLLRIHRDLHPDIFAFWRSSKEPVGVLKVYEFAKKVPIEKQKEEWEKRFIKAEKAKGGRKAEGEVAYEKARKRCLAGAEMLALLHRADVGVDCSDLSFHTACPIMVKSDVELKDSQWKRIAQDCNDVFGKIVSGETEKETANGAAENAQA